MKVYFDLSEKYQNCQEPCQKLDDGEICKKILRKYLMIILNYFNIDMKEIKNN
ncbi:unnamed protein product [Paramecium pentaurelia]|uniref:Uncharacterized protein n=1 Tax=Paramecium pentaurelia TaxID=43138 RepID=A0A8S1X433_9CILI|nr:unnamed protein product [Paramecium pentaurelia]